MRVKLALFLDAAAIEEKIASTFESMSLTGLGADGTSEYEVTEVALDTTDLTRIFVELTVERVEGKFASRDELVETIYGEVEDVEVTYDVEGLE